MSKLLPMCLGIAGTWSTELDFILTACPPALKYQKRFLHVGKLRPPLFNSALAGTFLSYLKGLAGSKVMKEHTKQELKQLNLMRIMKAGSLGSHHVRLAQKQLLQMSIQNLIESVARALRSGYIPGEHGAASYELSDEVKKVACEVL